MPIFAPRAAIGSQPRASPSNPADYLDGENGNGDDRTQQWVLAEPVVDRRAFFAVAVAALVTVAAAVAANVGFVVQQRHGVAP